MVIDDEAFKQCLQDLRLQIQVDIRVAHVGLLEDLNKSRPKAARSGNNGARTGDTQDGEQLRNAVSGVSAQSLQSLPTLPDDIVTSLDPVFLETIIDEADNISCGSSPLATMTRQPQPPLAAWTSPQGASSRSDRRTNTVPANLNRIARPQLVAILPPEELVGFQAAPLVPDKLPDTNLITAPLSSMSLSRAQMHSPISQGPVSQVPLRREHNPLSTCGLSSIARGGRIGTRTKTATGPTRAGSMLSNSGVLDRHSCPKIRQSKDHRKGGQSIQGTNDRESLTSNAPLATLGSTEVNPPGMGPPQSSGSGFYAQPSTVANAASAATAHSQRTPMSNVVDPKRDSAGRPRKGGVAALSSLAYAAGGTLSAIKDRGSTTLRGGTRSEDVVSRVRPRPSRQGSDLSEVTVSTNERRASGTSRGKRTSGTSRATGDDGLDEDCIMEERDTQETDDPSEVRGSVSFDCPSDYEEAKTNRTTFRKSVAMKRAATTATWQGDTQVEGKSLVGRLKMGSRSHQSTSRPVGRHEEETIHTRLLRVVSSPLFEWCFTLVTVMNSLLIGVQTGYMAKHITEAVPMVYTFFDKIFCVLFVTELFMRLFAYRRSYLREMGWRWGIFDIVVVGLQLVEEMLKLVMLVFSGDVDIGNLSFVRAMRILRLIRVLRIIRIIRFMDELRTLVVSITNSMRSLFWTLSLLLLGIYVVGIYFTQLVLDNRLANQNQGTSPALTDLFGGLPQSMLSLYQAMSGGIDWNELSNPLVNDISPFQGLVVTLYIAFTLLALTNVVTGVFVEGALKSAKQEEESLMMETLRRMFCTSDRTGRLSKLHFTRRVAEQDMINYLKSIQVDPAEATMLFTLIDEEGHGLIDFEEFVGGCMRIRGSARAIDSILLLHEVVETRRDLELYRHWAEEQMANVAVAVKAEIVPLEDYFAQEEVQDMNCEEYDDDFTASCSNSIVPGRP